MDIIMVDIGEENIDIALEKAAKGIEQYTFIMDLFQKTKVSTDREFQKKYTYFYKVRRNRDFLDAYYAFMEANRSKDITFKDTITYFYNEFNRIEASFSSKLVATINPQKPIWDQYVLTNIGLYSPKQYSKNRLQESIKCYQEINEWYENIINSVTGKIIIEKFNARYKNSNISNLKKIDFVLWQIR